VFLETGNREGAQLNHSKRGIELNAPAPGARKWMTENSQGNTTTPQNKKVGIVVSIGISDNVRCNLVDVTSRCCSCAFNLGAVLPVAAA